MSIFRLKTSKKKVAVGREELGKIRDIGDECVQRIIDERERRGGFESISDLDSIGGFGGEAIKNFREQACV